MAKKKRELVIRGGKPASDTNVWVLDKVKGEGDKTPKNGPKENK